jgi:hypothetical protein
MLKIGEFSKLAQVSVKTLRYYDELGLLRPDWVDRYTGYRYYDYGTKGGTNHGTTYRRQASVHRRRAAVHRLPHQRAV